MVSVTYDYLKRIIRGDDEGSEGQEDRVTDLYQHIYNLLPNITKWSRIRIIKLNGYKVKGVKFYFPPGCRNYIKLKLTYNGNSWIPQDIYSDPIQGDGILIYIPTNIIIGKNDYIEVWYRNLDHTGHRVDIQLDIHMTRDAVGPDNASVRRKDGDQSEYEDMYGR